MVNFLVKGPFDIPIKKTANGAEFIDVDRLGELVTLADGAFAKPGCYVFSWNAGHGAVPVYVGRATGKLLKEAFNPRNLHNLAEYMNNKKRGKMQVSIVFQERVRLFSNKGAINKIEEFLIGHAARKNPELLNIHGTNGDSWSIQGVANSGPGGPGQSATDFKAMMGMD